MLPCRPRPQGVRSGQAGSTRNARPTVPGYAMIKRRLMLYCALALAGATTASAQVEHHVCRLLKPDEVKALLGPTIVLANVIEEGPERSICQYEDAKSPVFILTVYWKGGKNQWAASTAALKAGDRMLAGSEGVGIDSLGKAEVVKAGPVQGLGDAAYFSELLPSLVLKGDVLLELNMAPMKAPGRTFRPLVEKLLARI
jgi:hypothetical protein